MAIILHVDDSSFSRLQIGKVLKNGGHEIIPADNGKSALELLRTTTPDLIISDILMPDMDGITFLEILRNRGNTIPIIMVTADVQKDTETICLALGASALFNKPPNGDDLLAAIVQALGKGV
ncbi:MAG: response regulator [Desulfuromonadaceae bacterium]|nr:response regulator [Desulfuromonadaceae bacterium]